MSNTILIGNDHGAMDLKKLIVRHLTNKGYQVKNMGADEGDSVDYPNKANQVCREFLQGDYLFAVLLCGTGIGMSIAANKIKGIRCALPQNLFAAKMCKLHNNANAIAFGGRIEYSDSVPSMIDEYMATEFEGGRHGRRVTQIMNLEAQSDS